MTEREEDGAYSMQGIVDVELAPVYGEGAAGAFRRLMDDIHKLERCVQDICSTDPQDDKKRMRRLKMDCWKPPTAGSLTTLLSSNGNKIRIADC